MENLANILIIDDLPTNLDVVSKILAPLGYTISIFTNGEQALKQLKRYQPDLILLDIQMPGMNGFEVCERIKANPDTAQIPIIFLAVQSDANSIVRAFDLGAVDYISKPFQATELVARVKTHLQLQRVNQFLEQQVTQRTQELVNQTKQLQVALSASQSSQKRFALLFEKAADAILLLSNQGVIDCNQACLNLFGYTHKSQLCSLHPSQLSPELQADGQLSRDKADTIIQIAYEQGSHCYEWLHQRRNGETFWTEVMLTTIPYGGEEIIHCLVRDISDRKAAEQQLNNLIAGTASTIGQNFFPALATHIAKTLNVSCVLITQRMDDEDDQLTSLALYFNHELQPNLTYNYIQTPCEPVMHEGEFYCSTRLQQHFPNDLPLVKLLGVDSYLGIAFKNSQGETIGGLSILNQGPIPNPERSKQILSVFAARAAAELERQRVNLALEELNQSLEAQVTERTAALQENEERLRLAMRAANQGFFDINLRTDEAIVSPEYALMLGYDPANFHETAETWRSRLHPEDSEPTHRAYRAYAAGQTPRYRAEFRQWTQQGKWKWILAMGQFIEWDEARQPTRFLGIHTDIHERKLAEIQLKAQYELLEQIARREPLSQVLRVLVERMEQCVEGAICLLMLRDNDNCLRYGAGISLPAAYAEAANCVQIVEQLSLCTRAAYTKQTVIVEDFATSPLLSPDYKVLAAKYGFQAGWSVPIIANDKSLLGTFTIHYQEIKLPQANELGIITQMAHIAGIAIERRQADEQLRRSEANLLKAQRVAHVGNWELNVATQTVIWSPEMFRIYGLEPAETAPSYPDCLKMFQVDDRQTLKQYIERAISDGTPYTFEYSMVRPDDTVSHHECRAEVERDGQGQVTRLFGTVLDITKRKQAELALQNLIAGTAATTGQDFFPALVCHIAKALNVTYAIVTEKIDDTLHTLAFWGQDTLRPRHIYPIADTPCEQVFQVGEFYCDTNVQQLFPHDRDLVDLDVESYLGIALSNTQGQGIGHLFVMNPQPIASPKRAQQILRVFAARAAAELERKQAEQALQNLIAGTATATGKDFFPVLVSYMAMVLNVSYAIVSELVDDSLNTLAFWANGAMQTNLTYHPSQTPCELTLREGRFYCGHALQQQFPYDPDLVEMNADSYLGIALQDAQGRAIGDLCILNHQEIPNPQHAEQIMRVFAARAAAELERQRAQTELEELNTALEAKVEERTTELSTSRAYYQGIISDQTELICRFLPDSTLTFVNRAYCEFFQKSPDELIGQRFIPMLPPEAQCIYLENFSNLSIDNPVSTYEHQILAPDGSLHWQQWSDRALFDADGNFIEYQAVGRDITARKRAEQALENLIVGTAATTGQDFFPALVRHISDALDIAYVFVAAKVKDYEMDILAFWSAGTLQPTCSYDPRPMPCQRILDEGRLYCEHSIQEMFPEDDLLVELNAQSYLGVAIYNAQGEAIGNLCVFDSKAILEPQRAEQILRVFAARAGAELERQWAKTALEQLNQSLEIKVTERTAELQERESRLRTSEQRYISLAAAAPVGIFRHDSAGQCIYVNYRACEITGLSREVLMGNQWQNALHPEDRELVMTTWIEAFQTQTTFQLEYRFQQPDGTVRWVYTQAVAEQDTLGQMMGYVGTITDISDRKQTELALQNLIEGTAATTGQDFFPALVHHIAGALEAAYVLVAEYMEGDVHALAVWASDRLQPNFSYTPINGPCKRALQEGFYYCPDSVQEAFPEDPALAELEAVCFLGIALYGNQGKLIGILYILNQQPLRDPDRAEQILRVFGARSAAELERQRAQTALEKLNRSLETKVTERTAELQASQAYYQSIVADQTELICRFLPDGTLTFVNDAYCQYFQRSSEELVGSNFLDLLLQKDRAATQQTFNNLSFENPVIVYEYQVIAPDNTLCWQQWTDRAFFDASGKAIEFQAVGRDITALKDTTAQLEASNTQLEVSNKELESFAYSVSHDLRAPLRAIDGFSKALLEDYGGTFDEVANSYFDRIRKNISRMSMLIDDLLSLSRVSQVELHYSNVNLTSLAYELIRELQESDPARHVKVIIAPNMTIVADLTLMRIMLTNLLQNAWKFTSHHSTARIEFGMQTNKGQPTTYFVQDDGAGFNMAYIDKLFGVFHRLHTENQFPGTGIGLATVQRIIHRHSGTVWADAIVEQGATFYFTVPQPAKAGNIIHQGNV